VPKYYYCTPDKLSTAVKTILYKVGNHTVVTLPQIAGTLGIDFMDNKTDSRITYS